MQGADRRKRQTLAGGPEVEANGAKERQLAPHDAAVLAALRATDCHPTAGELYDAVRRGYPHIGRATVYRALQRLEAAGLAIQVGRDNLGRHYDARTDRHDHAVCTVCGGVHDILPEDDLPPELLAGLAELAQAAGVAMETYEVRMYGRCTACQEAAAVPAQMHDMHDMHDTTLTLVARGDTNA